MTATSLSNGRAIRFDSDKWLWVYCEDDTPIEEQPKPCVNCNRHAAVMDLPDNIDPGKEVRTAAVDACIVPVIELLWSKSINTLSCCCGHGKISPSIVISGGYDDDEITGIRELIAQVDPRAWDIFQWRITKV